uniref:Methyltransferase domain-containing protein n=1 Tax=Candidatus Kentrum sp. FW TaxID=2126338 RepID=A0A450T5V8_9GAMM|nr:MAG: Methyltransferase domain-containing protein [Candidatus Kentron sp. FW]VFJ67448.1 MAG: Methyltransferase domain-containing protein [Candidatus Kentron sp. FW]
MKKKILGLLVCPRCLPNNSPLQAEIVQEEEEDIIDGTLVCAGCGARFAIEDGVAILDPNWEQQKEIPNKYETIDTVSSYLWSHYGELLNDENSSEAYSTWATRMQPHAGISLDAGGAVGRFTFDMSAKCDFAIGIDNSVAFIKAARQLMKERQVTFRLKDEGLLSFDATIILPQEWKSEKVEFIVGDALALPLRNDGISSFSSLNLVDKVPSPIRHLEEMNRVTGDKDAQFLLSDPFSWSLEAADMEEWLGGKNDGPHAGKGLDNIAHLLEEGGRLGPGWQVEERGDTWWKIRTHSNHYELIRSRFVKASR